MTLGVCLEGHLWAPSSLTIVVLLSVKNLGSKAWGQDKHYATLQQGWTTQPLTWGISQSKHSPSKGELTLKLTSSSKSSQHDFSLVLCPKSTIGKRLHAIHAFTNSTKMLILPSMQLAYREESDYTETLSSCKVWHFLKESIELGLGTKPPLCLRDPCWVCTFIPWINVSQHPWMS